VIYLGKRKRRVERLVARAEGLEAVASDGSTAVQISLFPAT